MTSFAGTLRQARYDAIPQLPELLPELAVDRNIILDALKAAYAAKDRDPAEVPRGDWNKAERYTIAGHFIIKQADMSVEGTGAEARFKDFRAVPGDRRSADNFQKSIYATQVIAARRVKADSRGNEGWFRNSYTLGARRYCQLGAKAFFADGFNRRVGNVRHIRPGVNFEGLFLGFGMRTQALRGALDLHMDSMEDAVKELPDDERLRAAHDLSFMPLGLTALHLFNLPNGTIKVPPLKAAKDEQTGLYRAVYDNPGDSRMMYRARFTDLPTERHKCPAHARLLDPATGSREDSALQDMFHAGINAAVEHGYYEL